MPAVRPSRTTSARPSRNSTSGATSSTYNATATATTYYQCVLTCSSGGATATSASAVVSGPSAPSNDNCSGAYVIPTANLGGTWNTGFTTACATYDSYSGNCTNDDNNVWFSFVAQGPNVEVTVTGPSGFYPEIGVYNNTCSSSSAVEYLCGSNYPYSNSTISVFNNLPSQTPLVTGNTYYVSVDSWGSANTFSIQINSAGVNQPGTNCATGQILCAGGSYGGAANLWGVQELTTSNIYSCNLNEEINSSWYILNVLTGGTLTFTLAALDGTDDYDYAIYQGATCSLGAPVSCNYSAYEGITGISTASGGTSNNEPAYSTYSSTWNKDLNVSAGVYIMYVNGFTPAAQGYNFTFGGTAVLGCTLPTVLSIQLLNFTASLHEDEVNLKWSTASESGNRYFTVERSADNKNFTEIAKVDAVGTTKERSDYSTIDPAPLPGVSYYRLSQTDINGGVNYLNIVSVNNIENDGLFTVVPNPTDGIVNITYSCDAATTGMLNLYDCNGRLVLSKEISCVSGNNKTQLDLSGKIGGLYLITFSTNDKFYRTKLMKK